MSHEENSGDSTPENQDVEQGVSEENSSSEMKQSAAESPKQKKEPSTANLEGNVPENVEATAAEPDEAETEGESKSGAQERVGTATEESVGEALKWYVVRTYSGYEQKAKVALKERIKQHKLENLFSDVLIPSENVIELVRGEKKTTSRKFFPGYMLVKMVLNDNTWHLIKGTPRVTGFVGNARQPPSVPEEEVAKVATQMQEGTLKPRPKVQFTEGENVRVIDGPFVNFNGVVQEVKPDKGKLRVMVSIFGRSTPVELDFVQVEKN